jgi:homoserine dehydrogenase
VLGDVVSVMTGGARPPAPPLALPLVEDVESAFYLHLDVADRPGVLASVTKVLGEHDVSIKSVVQRGMGEHARLVMITHPVLESGLGVAIERLTDFEFVRSTPRTIRVIEEEFV